MFGANSPLPFRGGAGGGGCSSSTASLDSPHPNPSPEGEGLSRRALLGTGLSIVALQTLSVQAYAGVGDLRPHVFMASGFRYGRAERFRSPVLVEEIEQVDSIFGPSSPQSGSRYLPQSEDCLFLNIWTTGDSKNALDTSERQRKLKPVMVYFHGGAYSSGSVSDELNDGSDLAERGDVVVVTVNHRLNAFGYLYLARLDPRYPDSGNLGQLDLILALQWIQRNIPNFGGDPKNVTVFGQSGGGAKIATLMAMPAAKGLFHKAITMSGQQVTASGPLNATKRAEAFLEKLGKGVDPATAPVEQLIAALSATDPILGGGVYMGPVLDERNLAPTSFLPRCAAAIAAYPDAAWQHRCRNARFLSARSSQDQGAGLE